MAPVALAAVWFGRPWLALLALLAMAAMAWEWARLCGRGAVGAPGFAILGSGLAAVAALVAGLSVPVALAVAAVGAAGVLVVAAKSGGEPLWAAVGILWIAAGTIAFLWLAEPPTGDRRSAFWLFAVVWTTDIAAYAAGRAIGGPKLAPRLSPNKTWAGFIGGVSCAGLAGGLVARLTGGEPLIVAAVSLLTAVSAQLGDLAESLAKRHFGVKDSSGLIPGHGGLLDRVDGLLAAAMTAGVVTVVTGGAALAWR